MHSLSVNKASANSSMTANIKSLCSSNNYPLLPAYQADTCNAACHYNSTDATAYGNGKSRRTITDLYRYGQ